LVSEAGVLPVIVWVGKPYEGIDHHYEFLQARVGRGEARRLVQVAERLGFAGLSARYESGITDASSERVAGRPGGQLRCIECHGSHPPGFWTFWRRVHRYAPLVSGYLPWWARGRCGRLAGWWVDRAERGVAADPRPHDGFSGHDAAAAGRGG
jgi:hypothetical protein